MPRGYYPRKGKPLAERFWPKVDKSAGPDGCWLYNGDGTKRGGITLEWPSKKKVKAAQAAWILEHGSLPPAPLEVCHTCDVGGCVNLKHLYAGTRLDNMQDMSERKRAGKGRGDRHPRARLSKAKVSDMRWLSFLGVSDQTVGKMFEVDTWHARQVLDGKLWVPPYKEDAGTSQLSAI